jgi:hypothetical protein
MFYKLHLGHVAYTRFDDEDLPNENLVKMIDSNTSNEFSIFSEIDKSLQILGICSGGTVEKFSLVAILTGDY